MKQAVEFLYGIPKFTKKHSLAHTKHFMELLGNPGNHCKVIHVAGSNGKGSVCCFLYHMLLSEGKTVGLFTSRRPRSHVEFIADFYLIEIRLA